ncbi:hypothetical protein protein [Bacillus cereus G9241]|nr:hypothetical protein protein [Bacillus cereus G9241]
MIGNVLVMIRMSSIFAGYCFMALERRSFVLGQ